MLSCDLLLFAHGAPESYSLSFDLWLFCSSIDALVADSLCQLSDCVDSLQGIVIFNINSSKCEQLNELIREDQRLSVPYRRCNNFQDSFCSNNVHMERCACLPSGGFAQ